MCLIGALFLSIDCVQCIQHFGLNKRAICSLLRHSSQKSSHTGLLYLMLTKSCICHFHPFKNPCKHCWGINLLQMIKYQIKSFWSQLFFGCSILNTFKDKEIEATTLSRLKIAKNMNPHH